MIVDPQSGIASTGTLLIVTVIVEFVCRTVATVIASVWPSNWDARWPAQAPLLRFPGAVCNFFLYAQSYHSYINGVVAV